RLNVPSPLFTNGTFRCASATTILLFMAAWCARSSGSNSRILSLRRLLRSPLVVSPPQLSRRRCFTLKAARPTDVFDIFVYLSVDIAAHLEPLAALLQMRGNITNY